MKGAYMRNIVVIDAKGGGLGAAIIKSLRDRFSHDINILALGTNAIATAAMNKSGASQCATGENAIRIGVRDADIIIGGIGIIAASGMLGEITPLMAQAIAESRANKVLIPMSRCNIYIPGTSSVPMSDLISAAVETAASLL